MANDFHAADVWTLLAHWAEETPEAPAFLHGERTISFAELHEQSLRAAQGLADSASDRAIAWRCGCPTCRPIRSSTSPARGWAPSPSRSTRAIARSRSPTSSAAPAPRCWPARRAFGGIDFLSILAEIEPAALDGLAAIVVVGDAPERGAARHRAAAARAVRSPAVAPAPRRQSRRAQSAVQHLHDLGHDQRAEVRAASPGRDRDPRPAGRARLRLRRARDAVALHPAAVRRVRLQPDDVDARRRQAHACWSSPTRSRRSPG